MITEIYTVNDQAECAPIARCRWYHRPGSFLIRLTGLAPE